MRDENEVRRVRGAARIARPASDEARGDTRRPASGARGGRAGGRAGGREGGGWSGAGRRAGSAGRRDDGELVAPVTVRALAEHPRVAGRYRVRCTGERLAPDAVADSRAPHDGLEAGDVLADRSARRGGSPGAREGECVLVVGAAAIADFALRAGLVLDEGAWLRLRREARIVAAQDRALRSLASGRRSERDLSVRLRRHEPDAAVVTEAIARLRALGLVDDAEFAAAEAAARLRRGTVATGDVRRRLRQRGVAADVVDEAIAAAADEFEVDDAARCREAAAKRARQLASLAPDVARRRLAGWLMRRGFSPGLVAETVRRVVSRGGGGPDGGDWSPDDDA